MIARSTPKPSPRRVALPLDAPVFDAHCHVLNLEYLLAEGVQILWDMVHGTYPLPPESAFAHSGLPRPDFEHRDRIAEAESFLAWVLQIAFAAFRGEMANVDELRRAGARVWQVPSLNLVPLMMDVYSPFAPPLAPDEWVAAPTALLTTENPWNTRARADAVSSTGSSPVERSAVRVPSTASSSTPGSDAIPSTPPSSRSSISAPDRAYP
jgi:hypothetical protein